MSHQNIISAWDRSHQTHMQTVMHAARMSALVTKVIEYSESGERVPSFLNDMLKQRLGEWNEWSTHFNIDKINNEQPTND